MTNKEFYKEQILDLACKGKGIAIDVMTNKLCDCVSISCRNCLFSNKRDGCEVCREKWSNAEYLDTCPFEKDELVEVSDNGTCWNLRHFSHKRDDGEYCTYHDGKKSSDTQHVTVWRYCRKYGTLGGLVKEQKNERKNQM